MTGKRRHYHHSPARAVLTAVGAGINVLALMAMVATAYAGCLNPAAYRGAGIAAMCFMPMAVVNAALLAVNLIVCRKLAAVNALAMLLTAVPLLHICPLHPSALTGGSPRHSDGSATFTLLTYNCFGFDCFDGSPADTGTNPTLSYILDTDPDVMCLQESLNIQYPHLFLKHETRLGELAERYPYRWDSKKGCRNLTILSKYPGHKLSLDLGEQVWAGAMAVVLTMPDSTEMTVINVHLQSLGLTNDDKTLYRDITDGDTRVREIEAVRANLLSKLHHAFIQRAEQAQTIRKFIDTVDGPIVLAGDFNDVPDCYAMRVIEGNDLHQVYPRVGFGPMVTYHANRFLFRIDHILYRGDLAPLSLRRDKVNYSDHYPQLVTFRLH